MNDPLGESAPMIRVMLPQSMKRLYQLASCGQGEDHQAVVRNLIELINDTEKAEGKQAAEQLFDILCKVLDEGMEAAGIYTECVLEELE